MSGQPELSGQRVVRAGVEQNIVTGLWQWVVVTDSTKTVSVGFDTSLAAARSMIEALRRHSAEL